MRQSMRVLVAATVFGGFAWISSPGVAGEAAGAMVDPGIRAIRALNDCIQERFKDVDLGFGYRRITRIGDTPHRFRPENVREMEAARELESARLQVVLYLTGREALHPKPVAMDATSVGAVVKGPVWITGLNAPDSQGNANAGGTAPREADLWAEAGRAMLMFKNRDSHDFEVDGWKFTARPVRASDAMCLRCHTERSAGRIPAAGSDNSLGIGDPLGAVLYGMRPSR